MASTTSSFLLLLSSLALLSILAEGQGRAPHGIAYESPQAFSPSAYDFFHPITRKPDGNTPCDTAAGSSCSPLPMAAQVEGLESKVLEQNHGGSGRGGVVAIVFGCAFVVLLAMGAYYVRIKRSANLNRAKLVQPEA